jgi:iron(III) transport system ATP-binding protein
MAELRIAGLQKAFGGPKVLRGVDLAVASGNLVAILGASGSGKTTLLRLVCGFERADAGTIDIAGQVVSSRGVHVPAEQRRIGYVAQEGALFPHLTVADNVVFGLRRALRRGGQRAEALLELVGLPAAYVRRWPHELSGGEQQRVALARALAPGPRLVLLDEPFSSLDAALRTETRQAVAAALAATGATALLVTHDQAEALSMGHEVAVLRDGKIVQLASPEILYRRPIDAELARFVGEAVLLAGVAKAGCVTCSLGRLPLATGMPEGPVDVLVRPEQLRLVPLQEASGTRARVGSVTFYGHDASVSLILPGGDETQELTARVAGHMSPNPGDEVGLRVEGRVVAFSGGTVRRAGGSGKDQPHGRALADGGVDRQPAAAGDHEALHHPQPKADALPLAFGRKE